MDEGSSVSVSNSFEERAAGRLATSFFLDIAAIGRTPGRMLDALLVAAISQANTSPLLRDPALQIAYARLDTPPPDTLRRPVSINALAVSLRLPFETVRRHVKQLIAENVCAAGPHGVYVPAASVSTPQFDAAIKGRYDRLLQFYDELRAVNAIEPLPCRPLPADDPRAPVRAAARIISDFFFRTIDTLHRQVPDPHSAVIMLEVVRSSSEHLPLAQAEAAMRISWIPFEVREPVRVARVARRLDLPYETTRRHVGWLVDHGFCQRIEGGVLPAATYTQRTQLAAATAETNANIQRMFRQMAALAIGQESRAGASAPPA